MYIFIYTYKTALALRAMHLVPRLRTIETYGIECAFCRTRPRAWERLGRLCEASWGSCRSSVRLSMDQLQSHEPGNQPSALDLSRRPGVDRYLA